MKKTFGLRQFVVVMKTLREAVIDTAIGGGRLRPKVLKLLKKDPLTVFGLYEEEIVKAAAKSVLKGEEAARNLSACVDSTYRHERSLNGVELDVLKSGLQKYVRRGLSDKAIWCAIEMCSFKLSTEVRGKAIYTNFFHRVMICYLEDVASANRLRLWKKIDRKLFSETDRYKNVVNVVNILARCRHSREPSHYMAVFRPRDGDEADANLVSMFHPLVAFSEIGEPKQHFALQGNEKALEKEVKALMYCLENKLDDAVHWAMRIGKRPEVKVNRRRKKHVEYIIFDLLEEFMEKNCESLVPYVDIAVRWFTEIKTKERSLCYVVLILAVLNAPPKNNEIEKVDVKKFFTKNLGGEKIDIDSFVVDMHTRRGRIEGSDRVKFAFEGSVVEDEFLFRPEYKDFYTDCKILQELGRDEFLKYKHESRLEFIVRAQLTCSHSRPDTYFASERDGKTVFVKGPYASLEAAQVPVKIGDLKEKLGLARTSVRLEYLVPNQFIEEPPAVSLRNKLDCTEPQAFLIFASLVRGDIPTKLVSSKMWPETEVVDWEEVEGLTVLRGLGGLNEETQESFILNILFRIVVGVPDVAWRNFLIEEEIGMIAVDEEAVGKKISLRQLGKEGYKLIDEAVGQHDVRKVLRRWKHIFEKEGEELALERVKEILENRSISSVVRT